MNLNAKIEDLIKEWHEQSVIKDKAHERMKQLTAQVKKLTTLAKHAEGVFKVEENGILNEKL